ncbi:MAG: hypothetical protein KIT84_06840 [Labilithrix sp.]|nr:hypothetical protein [Labilithrix sp.]MCW5810710.1 hypothetical protein [Labilithrix sp.]
MKKTPRPDRAPDLAPGLAPDLTIVVATLAASALLLGACRDVSKFSTHDGRFEGRVVAGNLVRAGIGDDTRMCVTLDTERLQDTPGTVTTSDGRFRAAPLRPIPQLWHDPLSTLTFGDGRIQNLLYAASPTPLDGGQPEDSQDVFVILSLMQSKQIEARLLRGAPQTDAGVSPPGVATPMFAVFQLQEEPGPCSF